MKYGMEKPKKKIQIIHELHTTHQRKHREIGHRKKEALVSAVECKQKPNVV